MSYSTITASIKARLTANSPLAAILTGGIYTDRNVLQTGNQPTDVSGLIQPFCVVTSPTDAPIADRMIVAHYYYYVDFYLYDDQMRDYSNLAQAAQLIYRDIHRNFRPTSSEGSCDVIIRTSGAGQSGETAFTANRQIEYYRVLIERT